MTSFAAALLLASPSAAVQRPHYGGALRIAVSEDVATLDPARAATFADWLAISLVHGALYRLDEAGKPVPDLLAAPCRRQAAGKRWRCKLRRDVRFHDGRTLRAADVRRSLSRRVDGARAWIRGWITVEVKDDWTFRVLVPRPLTSTLLGLLLASPGMSIVRGMAPRVGVGPFRVASWQPDDGRAELVWHPEHHRGRPYLDRIRLTSSGSERAVVEAFHYGKADLVFVDSTRFERGVRITGPRRETLGLLVRERPVTSGAAQRRAVFGAAGQRGLAERIAGRTRPAESLVPHLGAPESARVRGGSGRTGRWFIGVPETLEAVANRLAASLGPAGRPWPIQPLGRTQWRRALASGGGRWDALLASWMHIDPWPEAALRTLASLAGVSDLGRSMAWIPLVDKARILVHAPALRGVRWSATGMPVLDSAFRMP